MTAKQALIELDKTATAMQSLGYDGVARSIRADVMVIQREIDEREDSEHD